MNRQIYLKFFPNIQNEFFKYPVILAVKFLENPAWNFSDIVPFWL